MSVLRPRPARQGDIQVSIRGVRNHCLTCRQIELDAIEVYQHDNALHVERCIDGALVASSPGWTEGEPGSRVRVARGTTGAMPINFPERDFAGRTRCLVQGLGRTILST